MAGFFNKLHTLLKAWTLQRATKIFFWPNFGQKKAASRINSLLHAGTSAAEIT
jgi:hypothetical protein